MCSNVSSFDYGGTAYYLDQASQFVTVSNNLAVDIKCAGLLQNFGLNCTIRNNVFALVSEDRFVPGSFVNGQSKPPPLATENLGGSEYPISVLSGAAPCYLLFMLTRAVLLPSLFQRPNVRRQHGRGDL